MFWIAVFLVSAEGLYSIKWPLSWRYLRVSLADISLFVQRINFLYHPSSLFNSITAWAVVPDPAKKSNIIASLFSTNDISNFNKPTFFGLLNGDDVVPNIFFNSVPAEVVLTSIY